MKKSLMLCGLLLALTASYASAAGVNLAWNNCASEGGVPNRNSTCLSNTGTNVLTGSFVLGADQLGTTGIEIVVDVATAGATLPAWWAFQSGGCRQGSLVMNATVSPTNTICNDWAGGAAAGGLAAYQIGAGGPNTSRMVGGFAVPAAAAAALSAGQENFAFNALINNAKTAGATGCAGCTSAACIVLNSINVVAGTASHELISAPTAPGSNFATWQGGGGITSGRGQGCPAATPTHSSTWSSVKTLYR